KSRCVAPFASHFLDRPVVTNGMEDLLYLGLFGKSVVTVESRDERDLEFASDPGEERISLSRRRQLGERLYLYEIVTVERISETTSDISSSTVTRISWSDSLSTDKRSEEKGPLTPAKYDKAAPMAFEHSSTDSWFIVVPFFPRGR